MLIISSAITRLRSWCNGEHVLDGLEPLLPGANLLLNLDPLGLVDLAHRCRLDDDLLVQLVDLGVDDTMTHGLNDPLLDVVLGNVQQLGNLLECFFALLSYVFLDAANLNILLLQNGLLFGDTLFLKKFVEFFDLGLELLDVLLQEQVDEVEQLLALLAAELDRFNKQNLFEIERVRTLDGVYDQAIDVCLLRLVDLLLFLSSANVHDPCGLHVDLEGS